MQEHNTRRFRVLESNVDWVTASFKPGLRADTIQTMADRWIDVREKGGYTSRPWAWQGYIGRTIDGISYGGREDSALVRLSGRVAATHAPTVLRLAHNVSRLDLQVTVQDQHYDFPWHDRVRSQAAQDARCQAGQTAITFIDRWPEGRTCYIGSRASDRYFRVYDKHAESAGKYPVGSWRWEIEYKRARAKKVASFLTQHLCSPETCRVIVSAGFHDYGVTMPTQTLPRGWSDAGIKARTTDEGRLAYLGTSIRPMIAKLLESTDRPTILQLLGLTDDADAGPLTRAEVDALTGEVGEGELLLDPPAGWDTIDPW